MCTIPKWSDFFVILEWVSTNKIIVNNLTVVLCIMQINHALLRQCRLKKIWNNKKSTTTLEKWYNQSVYNIYHNAAVFSLNFKDHKCMSLGSVETEGFMFLEVGEVDV